VLDQTLHKELNECFLLHGTSTNSVDAIARSGFDIRLSRDTAVYGRSIYLAETPDKAFMYTGKLVDSVVTRSVDLLSAFVFYFALTFYFGLLQCCHAYVL